MTLQLPTESGDHLAIWKPGRKNTGCIGGLFAFLFKNIIAIYEAEEQLFLLSHPKSLVLHLHILEEPDNPYTYTM